MLTRNFGTSSLQVSALGFGAGHIGYDGVTESDAHALLDRALDLGINFIDTARGYGLSEERIGRWLPAHRDEVVLSTKVWLRRRGRHGLERGRGPESDDWPGTALRFSAFTPGVSTAIVGTSRTANLGAAGAAVERGPLPVTERARWENAFAPHAGVWAGEV